ncbi:MULTISPECIES: alcohol dehydrogenase catalytic domain-containing protein [unclassified Corynebacterium]|uniref:alcohol dehydrogenase catalytic domain-containing protein n=1 Tax=unclassified Corynebacterium TaxID=2624378 RepID=UPI0029CA9EE0|nr:MULTISPECIES: alcohol dehydrogenase catalytic domain-containing protein [unclassified Corynebacterium]WPF66721.1 alcohol dehydrogenase catalytic domain-containing protein [Corynebacterium sp. 22KM0430]WPF69209.1 alcohol dehydrogenase catalytic domain-containing protein [Corynebacterium sp. 21KM1197]
MKSYVLRSYDNGGQWGWEDRPVPQPGPGEVLVRVRAAGLNPLDRMIAEGQFKQLFSYSLPQVMGQELAGIVEKVGPGVASDWMGEKIFTRPSIHALGAFAEYAVVRAEDYCPHAE